MEYIVLYACLAWGVTHSANLVWFSMTMIGEENECGSSFVDVDGWLGIVRVDVRSAS